MLLTKYNSIRNHICNIFYSVIVVENFVKAPTLDGNVINILKQADRKQGGKQQKKQCTWSII